jgi:hypothetical protein
MKKISDIKKLLYLITLFGVLNFQQTIAQCDFVDKTNGRRYIGECKTNTVNGVVTRVPDGKGKQINPDKSYFVGEFSNGQRIRGQYYWDDGSYVDSAFYENDNLKSGIYNYPNGAQYKGTFKNDEFDGKGIYSYESDRNEIQYEGEFKNGMFNGKGILIYKDGKKQDGQWKDDVFSGVLIGYLKDTPAYWDAINIITIGNEKYEVDKQQMDSITLSESTGKSYPNSESSIRKPTRYFYVKDGTQNHVVGVVRFEKSETGYPPKVLGEKVFLDTDKNLLRHLNRNRYNKPARLPLTHLEKNLYFDTNHCIWLLFSEKESVYHNPQNKYENLKFVRPIPNQYFSYETILNVDNSIIQKVKNGEYPTTINGTPIKTGEYQQTYNIEHSAFQTLPYENRWYGYNWLNYFNHHSEDVALHERGWIHYAEFPQNDYDNATIEEESLFEKCVNDIEKLNEYANKAPVGTAITSIPKQNAAPARIEDVVTLINKTCDDALIGHLKKYPLNLFNLLASQKSIRENTAPEQIISKNYNNDNNAEAAILRLMQLMPKDKHLKFLKYLEKDNNAILKNLVSNMSDKTIRLFGNNNYTSFIKELTIIYISEQNFWVSRFSEIGENKLLEQVINLYPMPFKSDFKQVSAIGIRGRDILPANEFHFIGSYDQISGTINIYREEHLRVFPAEGPPYSRWIRDTEATASGLKPLDPVIILTNNELPIVHTALEGGQFSNNAYVVPAIFFQYKEQKEFNQFLKDAVGITLDVVSIAGSGGIALATKAHWVVRLWAWAGIIGNIGDIANRTGITNEQVKKAVEIYNTALLFGSITGHGVSIIKLESKMPDKLQKILQENKSAMSMVQDIYSSWEFVVENIDEKLSNRETNILRDEFANFQKLGVVNETDERTKKVKEIIFSTVIQKTSKNNTQSSSVETKQQDKDLNGIQTITYHSPTSLISTSGEQFTVSGGDTFEGEMKDGKIIQGKVFRNGETVKIFWNKRNH